MTRGGTRPNIAVRPVMAIDGVNCRAADKQPRSIRPLYLLHLAPPSPVAWRACVRGFQSCLSLASCFLSDTVRGQRGKCVCVCVLRIDSGARLLPPGLRCTYGGELVEGEEKNAPAFVFPPRLFCRKVAQRSHR